MRQADLSIGDLAKLTGVPVTTLRAWETRYGFPLPDGRTRGGDKRVGNRRYSIATAARVQEVVEKSRDLRISLAIRQVVLGEDGPHPRQKRRRHLHQASA